MSSGAAIRADEMKHVPLREPVPVRAEASLAYPFPAARGQEDAAHHGLPRHRIHIGESIVELRTIARDAQGELSVPRSRVLLLIPFSGAAELCAGEAAMTCSAGTPFLHGGEARLAVAWKAGTSCLLLFLRRDRVNAAISAILADGRRLASVAVGLEGGDEEQRLERVAERVLRFAASGVAPQPAAGAALESALCDALAERVSGRSDLSAVAPPVRAVSEAMRVVREDHCRPYDVEMLAARVGVTGQTLRKGFRSCLGMTVKEYIRSVRLAWAYERLDSARESRSLGDMARAAGFASTPAFSRAYLSRYGEAPSRTRARAVQRQT